MIAGEHSAASEAGRIPAGSGRRPVRRVDDDQAVGLSGRRMPGLDGFALADAHRRDKLPRLVPIVFPGRETGVAERARAYKPGAARFVTKPLGPEAVITLLAAVIERTACQSDAVIRAARRTIPSRQASR